jgi:2-methylcitrate dehydratase
LWARLNPELLASDWAKDAHLLTKNVTSPSTVNAIAGFADRAVPKSLKPDARKLYKRNILDSLGCAISALSGAPFAALRDQFAEYRSG